MTSPPERTRDFERLLTFIDAIAAIAITLLVLPLVEIVGDIDQDGSVRQLLSSHRDLFGSFFLSFVVIARLWLAQHRVLRPVIATTTPLTWLLFLWALTIVVLPFPTALVAEHDAASQAATKLLYVGTMIVSSVVLGLLALIVARRRELRDQDEAPDPAHSLASAVAFGLALVVMLAAPSTSYWPLLLLLFADRAAVWFTGRFGRDKRRS